MVTRAPTYTFSSSNPALFRKKGGTLAAKLNEEFRGIEAMAASGMQVSACTLYGGGIYANVFHWTNPISPSPVIVDHLVIKVNTASTAAGCYMTLGRSTNTGAGVNALAVADRCLAANSYPTRKNMSAGGIPLHAASIWDTRSCTGFQQRSTCMESGYQYLDGRSINAAPGTLAGTVYVFWYKAFPGAA